MNVLRRGARRGSRRRPPGAGLIGLLVFALVAGSIGIGALGAQTPAYRVVGVASDDALNVRAGAGVGNAIVGTLPFNATDVHWTGREMIAPDGGIWHEIEHADFSGPGWVNSSFLAPTASTAGPSGAEPARVASAPAAGNEPSPVDLAAAYVAVPGFTELDAQDFAVAIYGLLADGGGSVFLPDSAIGPLTKALLLVEANEGPLPRARYRIRYGIEWIEPQGAGGTVRLSLLQIDRFNMGPMIRDALAATGVPVAEEAEFGIGPSVSYRIAMRPVQGQQADPIAVSRAEWGRAQIGQLVCISMACDDLAPIGEIDAAWEEMSDLAIPALDLPYETERNGVLSPAAVLDLALTEAFVQTIDQGRFSWRGYEPGEGGGPGEPVVEAVIDVNLGQDDGIDAVLFSDGLLDDEIMAIWHRVVSYRGAGGPAAATQMARELWPHRASSYD